MKNPPNDNTHIEGLPGNRKAQTLLAWIGTAILVGYLVWTTDIDQAVNAFLRADLPLFLAIGLFSTLVLFVMDTAGIRAVFIANGWSVGWRRLLAIRGATYLIGMINYELGLAMLVLLASSDRPRKWADMAAPFVVLNLVDLLVLGLLVLTGLGAGNSAFSTPGAYVLALVALGGVALLPLLRLAARWQPSSEFLSRIPGGRIVKDVGGVSMQHLGVMMAWRISYVFISAGVDWFLLGTFGFKVPFAAQMQFFPILTFVAVLPVSVYGLGSTQVLMREFYGVFASVRGQTDAMVDAFSTSLIAFEMGMRLFIGVAFLPGVLRGWRALKGRSSSKI